jgi:L-cysteine desulfidase
LTQTMKWETMIDIMKKNVMPATGCTEPISLAYAAAVAAKHFGCPAERVEAYVSANLMKNGMGVTVPGTGRPGLQMAAAIGALDGDAEGGLQVLGHLHEDKVIEAKNMVDRGLATVAVKDVPQVLYSEANVYGQGHCVQVCIADSHTHIIFIKKDEKIIFSLPQNETAEIDPDVKFLRSLTFYDIYEFAVKTPLPMISFIKEAATLNDALSEIGLSGEYGLGMGHAMADKIDKNLIGTDLFNQVVMRTTAAADARMGGAPYAAMSNSGSGNQGICATVPVTVVARHLGADEERLIRALAFSHMTAIYIHGFLPKLSALCCGLTASMGGAAGMTLLMAGDYDTAARALSSMTGDVTGMVCDGAANSCAMKVGSASGSAFRSVMLALDGRRVSGNEGLVSDNVDESLRNIGVLATKGMQETDKQILDIMLHKNQ